MLDLRYDSIVYQSQVYVSALVDELTINKRLGKALDVKWEKVDLILSYLEALEEKGNLEGDDITDVTYILECLIILCDIASLPTAPTLLWNGTPSIIVGVPGAPGSTGNTGATGPTGLATDLQVSNVSVTSIVDSFPIASAKAARWDYFVSNGTAQRASSILGHWLPDGSLDELTDDGTEDIGGDTSGIEFDIVFSGGNIQLIATITSGTWTIAGSRYFIPNNGNGSGPVSSVLPNGNIFVGNILNVATAQVASGAFTISNTGVASLTPEGILDSHVAPSAGIVYSKLLALTPSRATVTDGSGFITTSGTSALQLGYLNDVLSPIQAQLNLKLSNPTLTIGDMIIRDAGNVTTRLPIGSTNQVLTVLGGVPTWSTAPGGVTGLSLGYIPKASSATTLVNSIISESTGAITIAGTGEVQGGIRTAATGVYFKWKVVDIGDWNMDTTSIKQITHGLVATKIRSVTAVIRSDDANDRFPVPCANATTSVVDLFFPSNSAPSAISNAVIVIARTTGGMFDSVNFNSTSFNRGWVTIMYEA